MTTEEKKQKTSEALTAFFANAAANGGPDVSRRVYDCPLMEGDVVTFKVTDEQSASDLLKFNDNNGVKFYAIVAADGREVSTTSLIGRKNNGVDVDGDTTAERIANFLDLIDERGEISLKVAKLRVLPSTRADFNAQRIITWAEA